MVLDQCPHCGVRHVQTSHQFDQPLTAGNGTKFWYVERCQNGACQKLVLAEISGTGAVERIFPFAQYELDGSAQIPDAVRNDFREAGLCLGAGCYKASLVMSRRVLQRCLADQGCSQNKLVDAINAAITNSILRKAFHALAEEIRHYGNLGAHPDDDNLAAAGQESALQVLEFARLLIHEFYEVPASATALKLLRKK
jgi:hypothetical protein